MGNCATKPKVLKDPDEPPPPVKSSKMEIVEEETEGARRSEKGKGILVASDEEADRPPSLSHFLNEDMQRGTIQIDNTEPEPVTLEIKNQTGLSPKPESSVPGIYELEVPQRMKQEIKNQTASSPDFPKPEPSLPEMLENQTGSSFEIPEDSVPKVSEVKVLEQLRQELNKNHTDPSSTVVPKMEPSVPETSEVIEIPEVSTEASRTFAAHQTPEREQVFEYVQEKIEPETVVYAKMATNKQDNKETVHADANNDKDTVFFEIENKKKDASFGSESRGNY